MRIVSLTIRLFSVLGVQEFGKKPACLLQVATLDAGHIRIDLDVLTHIRVKVVGQQLLGNAKRPDAAVGSRCLDRLIQAICIISKVGVESAEGLSHL